LANEKTPIDRGAVLNRRRIIAGGVNDLSGRGYIGGKVRSRVQVRGVAFARLRFSENQMHPPVEVDLTKEEFPRRKGMHGMKLRTWGGRKMWKGFANLRSTYKETVGETAPTEEVKGGECARLQSYRQWDKNYQKRNGF